jgi:hypothetical protein
LTLDDIDLSAPGEYEGAASSTRTPDPLPRWVLLRDNDDPDTLDVAFWQARPPAPGYLRWAEGRIGLSGRMSSLLLQRILNAA